MDTTLQTFLAQHPLQDNYRLLRVYAWYRTLLAVVLLGMFSLDMDPNILGKVYPQIYGYTVGIYAVLNVMTLLRLMGVRKAPTTVHIFGVCVLDIIALAIIVHCSGGVTSGIGLLIFITVAAGSIFVQGQLATFLAALACIAIIAESVIASYSDTSHNLLTAGLMGILVFVTSQIFQYLTRRIRSSQQTAEEQAAHAALMQQLNQLIVQRMYTGIAVLDKNNQIVLRNEAAERLLQLSREQQAESLLVFTSHPELARRLRQWRQNPQIRTSPLQLEEGSPEIQLNFSELASSTSPLTLIFIDDNRQLAQQAQQLKLASLGQLTANIAHEVRNPLGAISHAAQLLNESEHLNEADKRLATIIQNHCKRVNGIIENVLQLSRRQRPAPEKRDLGEWLRTFIQHYTQGQHEQNSSDIQLRLPETPLPVTVDFLQMEQVLTNLCDNACRYSQKKTGHRKMTLQAYQHPTLDIPCLDIIDYGEGIDAANREKLFEPFFTTEQQGTGLGLYIAHELCLANQVSLDYKHTAEGESCFQISFPHINKIL